MPVSAYFPANALRDVEGAVNLEVLLSVSSVPWLRPGVFWWSGPPESRAGPAVSISVHARGEATAQ